MTMLHNQSLPGLFPHKPITYDLYTAPSSHSKKIVIFSHGFKGFKDWGCWNWVAQEFSQNGLDFLKFDFSHNGKVPDSKENDLTDMIAFSNNNFSLELDDLSRVIDHFISYEKIFLLGHSMGGGISLITAVENPRVAGVVTWGSVTGFEKYFIDRDLKKWEQEGYLEVENTRTKKMLPLKYQLYQDILLHQDRLDISQLMGQLQIPNLLFHGQKDEVVPIEDPLALVAQHPHLNLQVIADGDHTFGSRHPWEDSQLPQPLDQVVTESIAFIKKH